MNRVSNYLHAVCAGEQTGALPIPVDEVLYFRADDRGTMVITSTGEHRICTPLSELQTLLDPEKFRQVHRFLVVNKDWIRNIRHENKDRMVLTLKDRDECFTVDLPYSRVFQEQ